MKTRLLPCEAWEKVPEGRMRVWLTSDHLQDLIFDMAHQTELANARARSLRKHDTVAEQKLWEALRNRRLGGLKFVRQLPIGPYFADFACRSKKLVVEVDGATHGDQHEVEYDLKRDEFFKTQGWTVVRCWNQDVYENTSGVCDSILLAIDPA